MFVAGLRGVRLAGALAMEALSLCPTNSVKSGVQVSEQLQYGVAWVNVQQQTTESTTAPLTGRDLFQDLTR